MLLLFTDFGTAGPYQGQMRAVLARLAPEVPAIDLVTEAPSRDPRAAAYLLAAATAAQPAGTVVLAVVDPGVGGTRAPIALDADGRWYVGPDNGLMEIVRRRAGQARTFRIAWRPERLSASFHGRDLFAPVAARLVRGDTADLAPHAPAGPRPGADWPDDLAEVIFLDVYGNAMTGLRAAALPADARLAVAGCVLSRARTFADVPPGAAFWYENADGLAEIAVNLGRADRLPGLGLGTPVALA